jgi:uncharacterized membrane protein YphA (DoxX/SURF4 family)
MQPKTPFDYTVLSLRVSLGVWFLLIGMDKMVRVGIEAFSRQVAEFLILQDPWNLPVAYVVVWIEVLSGLCLVTGWLRRGAVRAAVGLTLLFIFVNGQAMVLGFEPDCGCFGKFFELGQPAKMVLLAVQLSALVFVMISDGYRKKRLFGGSRMRLST